MTGKTTVLRSLHQRFSASVGRYPAAEPNPALQRTRPACAVSGITEGAWRGGPLSFIVRLRGGTMAHDLSPLTGDGFLDQAEIVARLIDTFVVHEIDCKKGAAIAAKMIAQLERMSAPGEVIESYRQRQWLALSVYVSDDGSENSYLSFALWPDERIFIGYHSQQHEEGSRALLERLASILEYQISLV